jgi:hypothetical protein
MELIKHSTIVGGHCAAASVVIGIKLNNGKGSQVPDGPETQENVCGVVVVVGVRYTWGST